MANPPPASGSLSALRRRLSRLEPSEKRPSPAVSPAGAADEMASRSGGFWLPTEAPVLCVEEALPVNYCHGRHSLDAFLRLNSETLTLLGGPRADSPGAAGESLFLDTETTGLSGGAGTYAFLVGAGWFEDGNFRLRQFLLPDPGSESAFLGALLELVQAKGFRRFITFNGKSYDLPLLESRCLLNRLDRSALGLAHVDLLYPGRAFWSGRFRDCSLQTLEQRVLAVRRGSDVPSELIPGSYFNFLRSGRFPLLPLILRHNRWDLLTLVGLASVMARAVADPESEPSVEASRTARLLERRGRLADAAALLEGGNGSGNGERRLQLALLRKRLGDYDRAIRLLTSAIDQSPAAPKAAFEEAAKLLEHRRRDLAAALAVVRQALKRFPGCAALEARRHRLECRLAGKRWY